MDVTSTLGTIPSLFPSSAVDFYATLGTTGRPAPHDAAREAETMFLSMLLKEMRQSFDTEESLFSGDKGDIYGGLFDLLMSRHLAEHGGIGLASVWSSWLEQAPKSKHPYEFPAPPTMSGPSSP